MNELLIQKVKSVVDKDIPLISNLSNVAAILNEMKDINWCGFYIVNNDSLYLGPFQGEVACVVIQKGRGVCGASLLRKETIIVPDVNKFDGHIACSSKSKSEIVTPIIKDNEVVAIIDIDSPTLNRFNKDDQNTLEEIAKILSEIF